MFIVALAITVAMAKWVAYNERKGSENKAKSKGGTA
jgi:hypothetical protein